MRPLSLLALLTLVGCDGANFRTDNDQLALSSAEMVDLAEGPDGAASAFLAHTDACFDVEVPASDAVPEGEYDPVACFAQEVSGVATATITYEPEDTVACLAFTAAGTAEWAFTPQECPGNDFGYAPVDDHVALTVVDAADVEGRLPLRLEEAVEAYEGEEGFLIDRPDDWRPADGEPLRIVAGQLFDVLPALRTKADGYPVAWRADTEIAVDGRALADPIENRQGFRVSTFEGEKAALSLEVGDTRIPVGEIEGVPLSDVAKIEIALLRVENAETGLTLPYMARAVVHDADGNVLLGVPVRWRFTPLVVASGVDNGQPGLDYLTFGAECTDPGTTVGEQRARLTASVGLVSDSIEVVWTPRLEADPQEGWVKPEECQPPCGCATGGGSVPLGAAFFGLVALLRRWVR